MKPLNLTYLVFVALSMTVLVSCKDNRVYESSQKIDQGVWQADTMITFTIVIPDTTKLYSIYLHVRHDLQYPYSNLYLFLETQFPNGMITHDTIECMLAGNDGKWLGSGIGHIRSNRFLFQRGIRFPVAGTYLFILEQAMRTEELTGIRDIGIRIDQNH